jgi:hypothetical protein
MSDVRELRSGELDAFAYIAGNAYPVLKLNSADDRQSYRERLRQDLNWRGTVRHVAHLWTGRGIGAELRARIGAPFCCAEAGVYDEVLGQHNDALSPPALPLSGSR